MRGGKQWNGDGSVVGKVYRSTTRWASEMAFSFIGLATETKNVDEQIYVRHFGSYDLRSQSILQIAQEYSPVSNLGQVTFGGDQAIRGVCQSFTGDGTAIEAIALRLARYSSKNANVYIRIWAHSGVYGTSSIPSGSIPLAESEPIDLSTIANVGGGFPDKMFYFKTPFQTVLGQYYVMTIEWWGSNSSSGSIYIYAEHAQPGAHSGNWGSLSNANVWTPQANRDLAFKIYSRTTAPFTPNSDVYLSDLDGGYSNTPGTIPVKIAKSYTTQKIMLQPVVTLSNIGTINYSYTGGATQVTDVILGYRPKSIELASALSPSYTSYAVSSVGFVDESGNNRAMFMGYTSNIGGGVQNYSVYLQWSGGACIYGTVQLFDWGFRLTLVGNSASYASIAYKINSLLTLV